MKPIPALVSLAALAAALRCRLIPGNLPWHIRSVFVVVAAAAVAKYVVVPVLGRLFRPRRSDIPL